MKLKLGTRRSQLATTQSGWVADQLRALGHEVELVLVTTEGDVSTKSLASLGGTGVFASALRQALLDGRIDLAVHSLKDLPVAQPEGLVLAAIPVREDPRDVLVARDGLTLGELPSGSVIGTGSPRRRAQLAALGLGVESKDIRGNVDSRVALVSSGALDGVILAKAGLSRLGRTEMITETIDPLQMLPAPGQGALAVEVRADNPEVRRVVAAIDDPDTRAAVTAERALLQGLEAGCAAPVGALAEIVEEADGSLEVSLRAFVGLTDGSVELRRSIVGSVDRAAELGRSLAATLLDEGAADLVDAERAVKDSANRPSHAAPPRPDDDRPDGSTARLDNAQTQSTERKSSTSHVERDPQ